MAEFTIEKPSLKAKLETTYAVGLLTGSLYAKKLDGWWICVVAKGDAKVGDLYAPNEYRLDILPPGTKITITT